MTFGNNIKSENWKKILWHAEFFELDHGKILGRVVILKYISFIKKISVSNLQTRVCDM